MNKNNKYYFYRDEISAIVKMYKNNELNTDIDEAHAGGFWDLSGQVSIDRQIDKITSDGEKDLNEAVFAGDDQEEIYNELKSLFIKEHEINCPLCNCEITSPENHNDTYIWSCPECPMIMFEYMSTKELNDLIDYLNE